MGGSDCELLGERRWSVRILDEDPVLVRVDRERPSVADDRAPEDLEVPGGILRGPEGGGRDEARRVVDRPDQGEHGAPALEPVVPAAVDLEEHARPRHPFAPAPVTRAPAGPWQRVSGVGHDPSDRPGRDRELGVAFLRERLGQMDRVEAGELGRRELDQTGADRFVRPVGRHPTVIAVDQGGRPLIPKPPGEAVDLAG